MGFNVEQLQIWSYIELITTRILQTLFHEAQNILAATKHWTPSSAIWSPHPSNPSIQDLFR
jgi:hypothetical protein